MTKDIQFLTPGNQRIFAYLYSKPTGRISKFHISKKANLTYASAHIILKQLEAYKLISVTVVNKREYSVKLTKKGEKIAYYIYELAQLEKKYIASHS